jgi:hypothetical protein
MRGRTGGFIAGYLSRSFRVWHRARVWNAWRLARVLGDENEPRRTKNPEFYDELI